MSGIPGVKKNHSCQLPVDLAGKMKAIGKYYK